MSKKTDQDQDISNIIYKLIKDHVLSYFSRYRPDFLTDTDFSLSKFKKVLRALFQNTLTPAQEKKLCHSFTVSRRLQSGEILDNYTEIFFKNSTGTDLYQLKGGALEYKNRIYFVSAAAHAIAEITTDFKKKNTVQWQMFESVCNKEIADKQEKNAAKEIKPKCVPILLTVGLAGIFMFICQNQSQTQKTTSNPPVYQHLTGKMTSNSAVLTPIQSRRLQGLDRIRSTLRVYCLGD